MSSKAMRRIAPMSVWPERHRGLARLNLRDELESGRLREFIAQKETRGVGPASVEVYNGALDLPVKGPQDNAK